MLELEHEEQGDIAEHRESTVSDVLKGKECVMATIKLGWLSKRCHRTPDHLRVGMIPSELKRISKPGVCGYAINR
ncbi:hypothetical protein Bca101_059522 [Brassica carinata]